MELWDLYDKNRIKTGKTVFRGEPVPEGLYHLIVHAWILSTDGRFLIQKRAPTVGMWQNLWFTTAGSALAGDDSRSALIREVREELGLALDLEEATLAFTVFREAERNISDIWLIRQDVNLERLTLQESEVSEVRWAYPQVILAMMESGSFVNLAYIRDVLKFSKAGDRP
jgi:8-oxo-dGTP pyrophosphatase MutT (NUDIX family)